MLGHLMVIDEALGTGVEEALGMEGTADTITPARDPIDMDLSPTLSLIKKAEPTLVGRKVAALVTDGTDEAVLNRLRTAVEKEGALLAIVAPKIGGVTTAKGKKLPADMALSGAPSVFLDAVVAVPSEAGAAPVVNEAAAIDWLRDAFGHLKAIGYVDAAMPFFVKAVIPWDGDAGVIDVARETPAFIEAAKQHRIWEREPCLRSPGSATRSSGGKCGTSPYPWAAFGHPSLR